MPIKDDDLVAQYIRAIENPDSIGYKDGKWYQPSDSKYDKNNRGFGIDVVHNKAARGIVSNRQGKWLTEEEERELRNKHIIESQKVLNKRVPWHSLRETPSEEKNAMAIGMLYRGNSVLGNQNIRNAYYSGSDEDMQRAVSEYYKAKKVPERAANHNKFFNSRKPKGKMELNYKPRNWFPEYQSYSEGGQLYGNAWDTLSLADKAEMIKVAVANGIITLPEIRQAYNKFAEGGGLNEGDDLTKLGGFTLPTLNVELKQQETPGEIVAQKPQISAPSGNIVNVNNRNTDTETAFRNYLDSPIIKTRLAKQYGSDQVDTKLQEMKDRFNKTSIIEGNFGSSYNNKGNIYIDTNATTPWMSNKFAKPITLSHELAHTMYPSNDFNVGKSTTYLNKIAPTEEGAKNIYRTEDVGKITDSYNDSTLGHDKQDYEKAAMVYEVREHMRKLGLWDYTSGQELTPDMWQKYNSIPVGGINLVHT